MSALQHILAELSQLNIKELEYVLLAVEKRLEQQKQVVQLLNSYCGIGKGIWDMDAQDFVNTLRDEE